MEVTTLSHGSEPEAAPFAEALARFRREIDGEIRAFLTGKRRQTAEVAPEAGVLVDTLQDLLERGGKRLRPALLVHAHLACGGGAGGVLPLALATELLHTYLLVHDDIMDHAEVRRGRPTAQVLFAGRHRDRHWRGDAADYGRSMALLVGDLAASYAFELAGRVEVPEERRAPLAECFSAMAQEVIHGQYLEILVSFASRPEAGDLERVLQLKSGRYSVERPIQLGALAAGIDEDRLAGLRRYGRALGEAFQLQDDLLGMFGDADTVGKPVGADLAEGKFTFLIHHALEALEPADAAWLESVRGRPDLTREEAQRARELMVASGARDRVREMVSRRLTEARRHLGSIRLDPRGRSFLDGLIDYSQERQR
jgi:geranylgeranyl diphosphate synthase type I